MYLFNTLCVDIDTLTRGLREKCSAGAVARVRVLRTINLTTRQGILELLNSRLADSRVSEFELFQ